MFKIKLVWRLYRLWVKFPGLRFGQFLVNIIALDSRNVDLFYLTDWAFMQVIENAEVKLNENK